MMLHDLGGLIVLIAVLWLLGRPLARQAARSWDIVYPRTRPTPAQVRGWVVPRLRSAASGARASARTVFGRPAGQQRIRDVVLGDPVPDDEGEGDEGDAAPASTRPPGKPAGTPPPARGPSAPEPAIPQPPASSAQPERTPTQVSTQAAPAGTSAAAVPGAEDMTTGMARLRAWMTDGNAEHKEAALRALEEVYMEHASAMRAMADSMRESGQHYPLRITENIAGIGSVLSAVATRCAETEAMVTAVIDSTGRDTLRDGTALDRSQFTEAGR